MGNKSAETWKPFDTGNMIIQGYEVSSLGRVREIETGVFLEAVEKGGAFPQYCVDGTWWRPEVLIRAIFSDKSNQPIAKQVYVSAWADESIEDFYALSPVDG